MAVVISIPAEDANSYSSIANVKAQWGKNPNIDYSSLTDEEIGDLAILATESIDLEYGEDYKGSIHNENYALFFPREGVYDRRGVAITDYTVFPSDLANAVASQAWWLHSVDLVDLEINTGISGVRSKNMDGLGGKEFFDPSDQILANRKSTISSDTKKWLSSFVQGGTSSYSQTMQRG